MALFGLFGRHNKGYTSSWLHLTVLYATARQGLEPEQTFALRGKIRAANPIDFQFVNADSFLVFFAGTPEGLHLANELVTALEKISADKEIPSFGVAVQQGECLAQMNGKGRFAAKPMGGLISQTKNLAVAAAVANTR